MPVTRWRDKQILRRCGALEIVNDTSHHACSLLASRYFQMPQASGFQSPRS